MDDVLSYHVFLPSRGWLADDEKFWTREFLSSAAFASAQLAKDIAARETASTNEAPYIFALLMS